MANYQLEPLAAGNAAHHNFEGLSIREITSNTILSCAGNANEISNITSALSNSLQLSWPNIGQCSTASNALCLGLQPDQCFVIIEEGHPNAKEAYSKLNDVAAVTDQSDGWITIELSGNRTRDVLERICAIDLDANHFTNHSVARTSMEHLNVILVRCDEDFLMLSPRTSAESFLHAVVQSAEFVI